MAQELFTILNILKIVILSPFPKMSKSFPFKNFPLYSILEKTFEAPEKCQLTK